MEADARLDADFAPSSGRSAEEKEANLLRAAKDNEIELEETEDSEGETDKKPVDKEGEPKAEAKVQEEPAEPQEEVVDVGGYKIPRKAAEALVAELQKGAEDEDEPKADEEAQALEAKRQELFEKVRKTAAGDPAIEGLVELVGQLQNDLATKEQREAEERQAIEQQDADRNILIQDKDEVEKEFGVKLDNDQLRVLVNTAAAIRVNRLKEAYKSVYGKKTPDQVAKPRYDSVDSRRQEKDSSDTLDPEMVKSIRQRAKAFGVDPNKIIDRLRKRSE